VILSFECGVVLFAVLCNVVDFVSCRGVCLVLIERLDLVNYIFNQ
jgi:hypothetical protein